MAYNNNNQYNNNSGYNNNNNNNNNNTNTYNNNNTNNYPQNDTTTTPPQSYNDNKNWGTTNNYIGGASILDQWEIRLTISLTILLVHILFNLIPAAIGNNDSTAATLKFVGFWVVFIGVIIPFLLYHFNVNGCGNNATRLVNKICGTFIIIGGLLILIGNIIFINDSAENDPNCDDENYVCCTCIGISYLCIFGCFCVILVGADLVSDYGNKQKSRITFFCIVFILGVLFILIPILANDHNYSSVEDAVIAGLFGVIIFGILSIIAVCIGNKMMGKFVGILFGCSILMTLIIGDAFDAHIVYVGFGGFIVYDLVN